MPLFSWHSICFSGIGRGGLLHALHAARPGKVIHMNIGITETVEGGWGASGRGLDWARMRIPRIGIALVFLLVTGVLVMTLFLSRYEERIKQNNFLEKGASMVRLMALHNIRDFEEGRRGLLMKTIGENLSRDRFRYLLVHDHRGKNLFSIGGDGIASRLPEQMESAALVTAAPKTQQFRVAGEEGELFEFSAPLFDGGRRTGTIRLGLVPTPVGLFSGERISLIALMAYFIIAALVLGYYGVLRRLKPLSNIENRFLSGMNRDAATLKRGSGDLQKVIEIVERSAEMVHSQMQQIKKDNLALVSRIGVAGFDRRHTSSILDAICFGIVVTDAQENVININQYMLNLLRKKRIDVVDRPLAAVIENAEILSYVAQQDNIVRTRGLKPIEIMLPELSPGERFQVALNHLNNRAEEQTGKMITIRNITAVKLAEESQQMFIAHVAHELLTPLTNIKSYSEMLMDGEVTDRETRREFYNTINGETGRLTRLIHTLLNIAKIEMGSLTIEKGLVRTDWFLEGCLAAIEATAKDKQLTIEKRMPDNFPSLMADKQLLQGAIINILGNALKYTPDQGKITFAISDQGDSVAFEVIDTGYGIAQEDLAHVFEKFYRSSRKEITGEAGSGLGLAITAEIVRLHGGSIDMKSELGVGTHVTIRIPKEEHYLGQT